MEVINVSPLKDTPLWSDFVKLHRFVDLLMMSENGEVHISVKDLMERWKVGSNVTVRKYIDYLVEIGLVNTKVNMKVNTEVNTKKSRNTTLITICNIESYTASKSKTKKTKVNTKVNTEVNTNVNTNIIPVVAPKIAKCQSLVHRAREVFEVYFEEVYGNPYYWEAKDAAAMKRLLKKIEFNRKGKSLSCDDESMLYALKAFLGSINKSWLANNFSVCKIDSQFNEIVSEIKNQRNNGTQSDNTMQYVLSRITSAQ